MSGRQSPKALSNKRYQMRIERIGIGFPGEALGNLADGQRVAGMVDDENTYAKVSRKGLELINVLWEVTGGGTARPQTAGIATP